MTQADEIPEELNFKEGCEGIEPSEWNFDNKATLKMFDEIEEIVFLKVMKDVTQTETISENKVSQTLKGKENA